VAVPVARAFAPATVATLLIVAGALAGIGRAALTTIRRAALTTIGRAALAAAWGDTAAWTALIAGVASPACRCDGRALTARPHIGAVVEAAGARRPGRLAFRAVEFSGRRTAVGSRATGRVGARAGLLTRGGARRRALTGGGGRLPSPVARAGRTGLTGGRIAAGRSSPAGRRIDDAVGRPALERRLPGRESSPRGRRRGPGGRRSALEACTVAPSPERAWAGRRSSQRSPAARLGALGVRPRDESHEPRARVAHAAEERTLRLEDGRDDPARVERQLQPRHRSRRHDECRARDCRDLARVRGRQETPEWPLLQCRSAPFPPREDPRGLTVGKGLAVLLPRPGERTSVPPARDGERTDAGRERALASEKR
jgi:hypothetical protein